MSHSQKNKSSSGESEYNDGMQKPQAAVMVLDHVPDEDEVSDLAAWHLEDFPADEAHATCEIVYSPPDWLDVHEQDQMGAFLRDGAACILIVYMQEGPGFDDEDDPDLDVEGY